MKTFTIGQVAKKAQVGVETVRYYEKRGVGTIAIQIAKHFATKIATTTSMENIDQIQAAYDYLQTGKAKGKVVIQVK